MVTEYILLGMTCSGCVAFIKTRLKTIPQIESVEPDLATQRLKITHASALSLKTLQNTLADVPKYSIQHLENAVNKPHFFTTYKPVLIIFTLLTLCCCIDIWNSIKERATMAFTMHHVMGVFMGGFFISFSFFKLLDVRGFATRFKTYDVLAMLFPVWALCYPFIECALGLLYLSSCNVMALHAFTSIIMLSGVVGVIYAMRSTQQIQCACLGAGFNLPIGAVTLVENGLMLLMSLLMMN
jgi:copper chaperone CopZ